MPALHHSRFFPHHFAQVQLRLILLFHCYGLFIGFDNKEGTRVGCLEESGASRRRFGLIKITIMGTINAQRFTNDKIGAVTAADIGLIYTKHPGQQCGRGAAGGGVIFTIKE